jgi:putative flavoprotein involved in K+ transport
MPEFVETMVVGGGQAGLAASYCLARARRRHLVLERSAHAAHAWRDQRWDSFTLVTPNWQIRMPGAEYAGPEPDGFLARDKVVDYFEQYVTRFRLPVRYGVEVRSISRNAAGTYAVATSAGDYECHNVVMATGFYQRPKIPALAGKLPPRFRQMHSSQYRNPAALPPGAVLVVGAGQSGAQIAEELYLSGRKVFLSVGRTARVPRRYRGRDIHWWSEALGILDLTVDQLRSPRDKFEPHPTISGRAGGRTLNLHQFARDGVVLLGRLQDVQGGAVIFALDLRDRLAEADRSEAEMVQAIDAFIEDTGLDAPHESLPELRDGYDAQPVPRLDLAANEITTVIWASGYEFDYGLVELPVVDDDGYPIQKRGVTEFPGLYFLGMPWIHNRKSGILFGAGDDASYVVSRILESTRTLQPAMAS